MDNQQERPAELSFVAGLIVGEGCFSLSVQDQNKNGALINPVFSMFLVDRDTVEYAYSVLKSNTLPGYFETRPKKPPSKEQYGVRCGGLKNLKRMCEAFIPLMTGDKRRAAEVVLGFCDHRLSLGRSAPYSPTDIEFVRRLREINNGRTTHRYPIERLAGILRDYTPCPSD